MVVEEEKAQKVQSLIATWSASNLNHDGLKDLINDIDPGWEARAEKEKLKPVDRKKARSEFARLKNFMTGRT